MLPKHDRSSTLDLDHLRLKLESFYETATPRQAAAIKAAEINVRHHPAARQLAGFTNNLKAAIESRAHTMRRNIDRSEHYRRNGNATARRACLEQAASQWQWFMWIMDNQQQPPDYASQVCPHCGLRNPDPDQTICSAGYDEAIAHSVLRAG